jgi:hypothetical protein
MCTNNVWVCTLSTTAIVALSGHIRFLPMLLLLLRNRPSQQKVRGETVAKPRFWTARPSARSQAQGAMSIHPERPASKSGLRHMIVFCPAHIVTTTLLPFPPSAARVERDSIVMEVVDNAWTGIGRVASPTRVGRHETPIVHAAKKRRAQKGVEPSAPPSCLCLDSLVPRQIRSCSKAFFSYDLAETELSWGPCSKCP